MIPDFHINSFIERKLAYIKMNIFKVYNSIDFDVYDNIQETINGFKIMKYLLTPKIFLFPLLYFSLANFSMPSLRESHVNFLTL